MKRTARLLSVATALGIWALPVWAATGDPGQAAPQKDECLLVAMLDNVNCPNRVDSVDNRIERLQKEIAKGNQVYTPDELTYLKKELKLYQSMQEYLERNAPYGDY
ncbi:hypothetical protein GMST_02130 [Geomonas silvestris]|uniref:Uncharacterized protein n=1 Tax=Geomonas silvestris TaxID=2740184 RepID=A0A6V8MD09_9BACT|nr:hypothetical protein [Geomonas silvestris]GFO57888.1 hypothetical protein GMST_02130 [Geomonas silvestris]